ncbi:MAG: hypothetical protein ACC628_02735 [Pirellulaceae bacterium]
MFTHIGVLFSDVAGHSGESFRRNLAGLLIAAAAVIALHWCLSLRGRRSANAKARWNRWEKLVYLGAMVSVAVLGFTSFFAVLRYGMLSGWLLFAHMFGAGLFVGVLPFLSVTWCEASRFEGHRTAARNDGPRRFFWFPKLMFWMILLGGFIVTVTMLLSMLPLLGTDGLIQLLDIHRYAGLLVVVAMMMHGYCVALQRVGWR